MSVAAATLPTPSMPTLGRKWRAWVARFFLVMVAADVAMAALAGLYVVKSAVGINLFEGHFFLHQWLYWG